MSGTVELGTVTTLAGSEEGFADGVGTAAKFSSPTDIGIDNEGNLYVLDAKNFKIRKVLRNGTVTTLAGSTKGYADGIGAAAKFGYMSSIAVAGDGVIYVVVDSSDIRRILPNGTVSTLEFFKEYGGRHIGYQPRSINCIAVNRRGYLYIGDGSKIKMILPNGLVTDFADIESSYYKIKIGYEDNNDIIYVIESSSILKILPNGRKQMLVSIDQEFVGGERLAGRIFEPINITIDNTGNLYITDNNRIRKMRPGGTLTTLAGKKKGFADGRGPEARFSYPQGIAIDTAGVVYIADSKNNRIRKMVIGRFEVTSENDAPASASGSASASAPPSSAAASSAPSAASAASVASAAAGAGSSAPSSASASSASSAAAAYSNFEGNALSSETRGRLWWQLNQMTCPSREADTHIPFVKAQLNLLYKTAVKTIESYKDKATPEQMATYQEHLRTIFTGVQVSFTSLNNTSVKCAMLFTKMLVDHPPDGVNADALLVYFGDYWKANWDKPESTPLNQMQLRGLVFHDEDHGCIPNCKNKGIIVLLGEMTLYELIWSYANDLYFIGLPTGVAYADGTLETPLSFLEHDIEHMQNRADIDAEVFSHPSFVPEFKREELIRRKDRAKENKNILKCLQYIRDKPKHIQDAVFLFLFLFVHEQNSQEGLDGPVSMELFQVGLLQSISYRLQNPRDMGGFLPRDFEKPDDKDELDAAVKTWVKAQLVIFVDTWNASLASDAVAINERPNANTLARYDERTKANAAEWNARGGRRTKRRKSARRKTQKNRFAF